MSAFYPDPGAGDREDEAFKRARQELDDAFAAGQRAGKLGLGAGLNDYEPGTPEHAEWMRAYQQGLARYMGRAA